MFQLIHPVSLTCTALLKLYWQSEDYIMAIGYGLAQSTKGYSIFEVNWFEFSCSVANAEKPVLGQRSCRFDLSCG